MIGNMRLSTQVTISDQRVVPKGIGQQADRKHQSECGVLEVWLKYDLLADGLSLSPPPPFFFSFLCFLFFF